MIIKRKTQIILALIVSSIFLFQNCALIIPGKSKRRLPEIVRNKGDIVITKKDGHEIEGELITVKENSLLLLDIYGEDASIEIRDIRTIRIVKKSKRGLGSLIGGAAGLVGGMVIAVTSPGEDASIFWCGFILGGLLAIPCSVLGGIAGAIVGIDETIQIEGMSDLQISYALEKLRKKARIRDYITIKLQKIKPKN